jgi:hypothetical protein
MCVRLTLVGKPVCFNAENAEIAEKCSASLRRAACFQPLSSPRSQRFKLVPLGHVFPCFIGVVKSIGMRL